MSAQYIFTMHRLSRSFPPDKEVLREVSLSFYPGAKIGVLGYNGAGKSTLLRIMAGTDTEYRGAAQLDGRMIDAASARMAQNVVDTDKAISGKSGVRGRESGVPVS